MYTWPRYPSPTTLGGAADPRLVYTWPSAGSEALLIHERREPAVDAALLVALREYELRYEELDLLPLLKASVDKLWDRPYDCRVFLMQLLQGLSDLDDQSLCMMC